MEQLQRQVARARRRLICEQFLNRFVWCLFAGLLASAAAIAAPKLFVIENLPAAWANIWLIGGAIAGLLVATVWTALSSRSRLDAAIEIDHRFGLRERVASSLSLAAADRETEAGQALMKDAVRAIGRVDIGEKIRVGVSRQAWLPLVPAVIAFCLMMFVSNREATSRSNVPTAQQQAEQVKLAAEALRKRIAERRKELEKRGLEDAEGIFKKIEESSSELAKKNDIDRTKAVVKLNDLGKELEQRRREIGGKEELQKQFNNLKDFKKGPADKFANAMKQGDWKQAMEQVKELQKDLAAGKLSDEQKQQLKQQMQQIQEKLAAMADAHQQAMEDLKKQIAEQQQKGNLAKAGELQQKLDQMAQQRPQMQQMQQMAQQMAQAQQALEQGDVQQAAQAMQQMAQQLGQMQQDMQEMELLDAAMDQLEMAKNAMGCQQCQGAGCEACQGMGMNGMDGMGQGEGQGEGMGMGRGQGKGPRPDSENATNLRDSRVRQNVGRGASVFGGFTEGGNVKGNVVEGIKEEMESLGSEPANPLAAERLPRSHREHAEEYFRSLR